MSISNLQMPDISLDSIEDLQGFEPPPKGRYLTLLSLSTREINSKANLIFDYTIQDTIELADPTAVPPKQGYKFSEMFSFEKGLPMAKEKLTKLAAALGLDTTARFSDIVESVQTIGVEVTVAHRAGKRDAANPEEPPKVYVSVPAATFTVV